MPVLPELIPMLARIEENRARMADASVPVAQQRAMIHRGMDQRAATVSLPAPAVTQQDHLVQVEGGEITVRSYTPAGMGPLPCHVYIHGGGWWLGELAHRDAVCGRLAADAGCVVFSVAHRLAPEHRFPVPPLDCYAALLWVAEHAARLGADASRLSIGGDSSGANLAAAVALMARDRSGPQLIAQVLEIPALDLTMSRVTNAAEALVLTPDELAANIDRYCGPEDRRHPYASPLLAGDLAGLPPALIMVAEYDILRDEGEAYGQALRREEVPAEVICWPGHVHGSHEMTAVLASAREWQACVATFLRGMSSNS
ncbi:alpha/beta hydrolase [Nonomuraea rubra]|uniref:Acetyl esterase n=2 Tax=Nonomuraea rubra TaxID=46180 RepID=A0A7X0NYA4_9ACTN|nr:alpha/beta hydrolase [Nonomuraea rubra]MBB6551874.1 acetyl esterase [Nonomuraea rubra]